jgi:hypothetical protein
MRTGRILNAVGLLLVLLALLLVPPLVDSEVQALTASILLTIVLIVGALSVRASGKMFKVVVALCVPAALTTWGINRTGPLMLLAVALYFIALLCVTFLTFRHAFARGVVTVDKILASINSYLMIATLFTVLYGVFARLNPAAFSGKISGGSFGYFSLITQTTVGYGDIVPTQPAARSAAALQAVLGQFYLTILVARLVALHVGQEGTPGNTPDTDSQH